MEKDLDLKQLENIGGQFKPSDLYTLKITAGTKWIFKTSRSGNLKVEASKVTTAFTEIEKKEITAAESSYELINVSAGAVIQKGKIGVLIKDKEEWKVI